MERKLATVLFVDLVDSTALVTAPIPRSCGAVSSVLRPRLALHDHHGGIVEKFAGDAVMAAFGIPQAHEDDAERAVRAALAILDSVHELELEARIGVESGEVVADDSDSTFATGEAVNVAARLQQDAEPGQILLGPGGAPANARPCRGRGSRPGRAAAGSTARSGPGARSVRNADERPRRCSSAARRPRRRARAARRTPTTARSRDRRAHLFTIYGEAGVGKSRLAHEF